MPDHSTGKFQQRRILPNPRNLLRGLSPFWREHLGPMVILSGFTVVLFWPLLRGNSYSIVAAHMRAQYPWHATVEPDRRVVGLHHTQSDHAETFYPLSVFATNAIRNGELPMWLPYSFGGIPAMELGTTGLLYPPRLIAMLLLSPIRQHDFLLVTHLMLAGLGMYSLLRTWGASALGGVIGAMVWQANGHNAFWLVLEHIAIVAAWLPVMLLAATMAVRRQSLEWATLVGVSMGLALLAGSAQYVYLGGLLLAAWYGLNALTRAYKLMRGSDYRSAASIIAMPVWSLLVAAGVSAAYWLPFVAWLSDVHRGPLTLDIQMTGVVRAAAVASSLIRTPPFFGLVAPEADFAGLAFIGLPATLLACWAAIRRTSYVVAAYVVCAASLAVAFGFKELIIVLRQILPFFTTIYPSALLYLFCFGAAVLAGFGAAEMARIIGRARLGSIVGSVILLGFIAAEGWQLARAMKRTNPRQPVAAKWLLPATPFIEAIRETQNSYHVLPASNQSREGPWVPPVLPGKVPAVFGIQAASGYESLLPRHVARLWRAVEQGGATGGKVPDAYRPTFYSDSLPIDLLGKLSVGILITPPQSKVLDLNGRDAVGDGLVEPVYEGIDGFIYKNRGALPRSFLAPAVIRCADPESALQRLIAPDFDPTKAVIVIEGDARNVDVPAALDQTQPGLSSITGESLNEVEVQVFASRTSVLVLNDCWAPGWRAYVDGAEHQVFRANFAFRGVVVPAGDHRVRFSYRPRSLIAGIWISCLSFALLGGAATFLTIRARRRD